MEELINIFPVQRREQLRCLFKGITSAEEVRIRQGWPIQIRAGERYYFCNMSKNGVWEVEEYGRTEKCLRYDAVTQREIREMLSYLTRYSLYAYEDQMGQGFMTIRGGHRAGFAGQVIKDGNKVKNFAYITGINLRIAREIIGCAQQIIPHIILEGRRIHNTLIVSPPGLGKTTLLRDCIRKLSYSGYRIGVVDERAELAASYHGETQTDLGPCSDVLDGCDKENGIEMLVRSMTPDILALDELGNEREEMVIERAFKCGCGLIATVHGRDIEDLFCSREIEKWLKCSWITRLIFLKKKEGMRYIEICDNSGRQVELRECEWRI